MRVFRVFLALLFTAANNINAVPLSSRHSTTTDFNLNVRALPTNKNSPHPGVNPTVPPSPATASHLCPTANAEGNRIPVVLGICAMDEKANSKPMKEIQNRIVQHAQGAIEVKVFGDKVIMDQDINNWPTCDALISFFSTGFPLDKAIAYVNLRNPFCINELPPQALLSDRRHVNAVLDHLKIPTPQRLEVSRDGGPKIDNNLKEHMQQKLGVVLGEQRHAPEFSFTDDTITANNVKMEKPFVEKPADGNNHDIYMYKKGGGGIRLHRKVGNKSGELDPDLNHPRTDGSYIYEKMIESDNSEDIKVYTVGHEFAHAETRKSPAVDGVVDRNAEGKEIRGTTQLNEDEKAWAAKICDAFGQRVCGFDMLRCENGAQSKVIDVNGWSFVKGDKSYYDKAAKIITDLCLKSSKSSASPASSAASSSPKRKRGH